VYESIHGRLLRRDPACAVVEAGGIGYRVLVPLSTYDALPPAGEPVTLLLYLVVREDEWRLYGFGRAEERATFQALLRVSGVGPALALSLLSGFRPAEFQAAVANADVRALTRVKGVGRKTAERIVVELRDVWPKGGGAAGAALPGGQGEAAGPVEDAIRALEALGMDPAEARRRVTKHAEATKGEPKVSTLVRQALRG
jgi:Holliday junction DNA helicase RuvA